MSGGTFLTCHNNGANMDDLRSSKYFQRSCRNDSNSTKSSRWVKEQWVLLDSLFYSEITERKPQRKRDEIPSPSWQTPVELAVKSQGMLCLNEVTCFSSKHTSLLLPHWYAAAIPITVSHLDAKTNTWIQQIHTPLAGPEINDWNRSRWRNISARKNLLFWISDDVFL